MRVTLTFDNGPHPVGTPVVLEHLAQRDITAIFFVVGNRASGAGRELVAAAAGAGHLIGNHTWSHRRPLGELTSRGAARDEIVRTQAAIAPFASEPPLFRPVGADPGGIIDDRLLNDEAAVTLRAGGYTVALWNVLAHDWDRPLEWPDIALAGCRGAGHAVVVLHDAHPHGLALLPGFLDALMRDGAEFTQTLPADCTPLIAGVPAPSIAPLIRGAPCGPHVAA